MKKYKWDADDYAKHSKAQLNWGQELIKKLNLEGNEHILDIGCGDGRLTAEISRAIPRGYVLGIDSSKDMISLANTEFRSNSNSNLSFVQLDAMEIDHHEKFDVIFSNAVLHWIPDHLSLLNKIYKSLKPQGRVLLQMGGKGNAADIIDVLSKMIVLDPWENYFRKSEMPYYYFYSPVEYENWVDQAGFIKLRAELIAKDMIHEDRSSFEGWIRTTWQPYLKNIPKEHRNQFIIELTNNYLKSYPERYSGTITVKMVRLEVDLIKPKSNPG
jgi:trans-aconitate methyltransferase